MKKIILLSILFIAPMTFASNVTPADFYGKYNGVKNTNCEDTRVYIGKNKYFGHESITLDFYRDDASGVTVVLGEGEMQVPGTVPSIHGVITQSWTTRTTPNSITVTTTIERKRDSTVRTSAQELYLMDDGDVVYAEYDVKEGDNIEYSHYCELNRVNKK